MKKILLTAVFILSSISLFAQKGWQVTIHPVDELQKTKEYTSYMYTDENGNNFVCWSNDKYNFRIINAEGIFDTDNNGHIRVQIGYYDMNNKLIKKEKKSLALVKNDYQKAETFNLFGGGKFLEYVKNEQGYVRILAPQYQKVSPWEIVVPCISNENK